MEIGGAWAWHNAGKRIPENNLVCEIYCELRALGIVAVTELRVPVGRLDLAVISPDLLTLRAIVEAKSDRRYEIDRSTNQWHRYHCIGVQIYGLNRWENVKPLAELIHRVHYLEQPESGVLLSAVMAIPKQMRRG